MPSKNTDDKELIKLEEKIKIAKSQNLPIEKYVLREIEILQDALDKFLASMEEQNRRNDIEIIHIEIRQYVAMRQLSLDIGLPVEKYNILIKQAQCRIFGEDNWETFFKNAP